MVEGSTLGSLAVVDDDRSVRRGLARLLGSIGLACVTHESGRDFLESPQLHEVDCLILDLHLPGLSGLEVLDELEIAATKLPVILMTGRYDSAFAADALAAGASAVLRKPFDDTELFRAIETATGQAVAH